MQMQAFADTSRAHVARRHGAGVPARRGGARNRWWNRASRGSDRPPAAWLTVWLTLWPTVWLTVWALLAQAGCQPGDLGIPRCPAGLLPGELVITELMAHPQAEVAIASTAAAGPGHLGTAAAQAGATWIEIFNATPGPIDLKGVVLVAGSEDGSNLSTHIMSAVVIDPGRYLVAASNPAATTTAVDYTYGDDLATLQATGGRVAIKCDVIEVDAVIYPALQAGVAHGLDGALAPDHEANDAADNWCSAKMTTSADERGSPGVGNAPCTGAPSHGCDDGATVRPAIPPGVGDLLITEVMPNPAAVSDAFGEWFEIYVAADVDLNGLAIGPDPAAPSAVLSDDRCLAATAGTYLLVATSADATQNGGLPPVAQSVDVDLRNTDGTLVLAIGDIIIDHIAWASAPTGAALSLDPAHMSPADNDVPGHWCTHADAVYGSGDTGTPGAPNLPCPVVLPEGMCRDGDMVRPLVPPVPEQVVISEYMANPTAVPDRDGEWIEVYWGADADLNGLEIGKEPGAVEDTITAEACLWVAAGTYVVLARQQEQNGGLPRVDALFGFDLKNSAGTVFVGSAGTVLDSISYDTVQPGVASSLDESDGSTWCPSPAGPYGDGDHGTPGAANPPCSAQPPRAWGVGPDGPGALERR